MISIERLNPGDSIRKKNSHVWEGERLIAEIYYGNQEVATIIALSSFLKNGTIEMLSFADIRNHYQKVDPNELPTPNKEGEKVIDVNSKLVDGLRESLNMASEKALGTCACGSDLVFMGSDPLLCAGCGKPKGAIGDFAFDPLHMNESQQEIVDKMGAISKAMFRATKGLKECGDQVEEDTFKIDLKYWRIIPSFALNLHCHMIEIEWLCFTVKIGL